MVLEDAAQCGAPYPSAEAERQAQVDDLCLSCHAQDPVFDQLVDLTARCFNAPIALVSILDHQRQWFLARVGLEAAETPRSQSFCAYAVLHQAPFQVSDALNDPRFKHNPLVTGAPHIRFYAGVPLITDEGMGLGSLCVIDTQPRPELDAEELGTLKKLASLVMARIMSLRESSFIDVPSGLLNSERLERDMTLLQQRVGNGSVVLVDVFTLSHVKDIVKALGFSFFNQLMRETANRLKSLLPPTSTLYRASQTRFATLLEGDDRTSCEALGITLLDALQKPIMCQGIPIQAQAAVGLLPLHAGVTDGPDGLRLSISAADYARSLNEKWAWFRTELDQSHQRSFALLGGLSAALMSPNQFRLEYQPKLSMRDGSLTGVEALLRWTHPELGPVGPAEFIPLAEKTALVHSLTLWVVQESLRQLNEWRAEGMNLTVSINISAGDLETPVFVDELVQQMRRYGIQAGALELEFTESVLIRSPEAVKLQLQRLQAMGIEVAIDDFGTGYSNWAYLRDIPASALKIDKSFLDDLQNNSADRHMAKAIIDLAHKLDFRVIAEGVETQEDYDLLAAWHCDEVQGYLLAKPMPPAALTGWIQQRYPPA
ncbi:sensor domain-containing phosphodiesterase [Halopseudomonas sp.]|uniref:sensor domain-containing phosphodiesterase n=1 Tax=Halopseudomonas sp. TaxID=2901191 RepID=UPI0030023EB0